MSKKLNRRQLREQEELAQLNALKTETLGEAVIIPHDAKKEVAPVSGFAALQLAAGSDKDEEGHSDKQESESDTPQEVTQASRKKKKKNKKKKAQTDSESPSVPAPPKSKPKPKSKGTTTDVNAMSIDEITALLDTGAHPTENDKSSAPNQPTVTSPHVLLRGAFALDIQHLDPALELKRQFGAAAIKAYEREKNSSGVPTRAGARSRENRGAAFNSNTRARTVLCTPKATWPDIGRTFVGMTMTTKETGRGRVCDWEHSRAYRQTQLQFAQAVASHDSNALIAMIRVFPWHISTLLQLADISRYQGDLGQASDFVDRVLFAMERTALPAFASGLASSAGPPQVDFMRVENRALWLAGHKNVDLFGRRGTWRTALEWCKFLYGLDTTDPHGMLLWIDFLAIKSKQGAWLLRFFDALEAERCRAISAAGHIDNARATTALDCDKSQAQETWQGALDWCVGACYGRALALRAVEKEEGDKTHTRSNAALRLAIARHPVAAALLCEQLSMSCPDHAAFQLREAWSAKEDSFGELLAHVYVHRSVSIWKEEGNKTWIADMLRETASAMENKPTTFGTADEITRMGVYRHVIVSDLPEALNQKLLRYIPPFVLTSPGAMDTYDPLPPVDGTRFDDQYYAALGKTATSLQRVDAAPDQEQPFNVLRHFQNLDPTELQQLIEHVDDETRTVGMNQPLPVANDGAEDGAVDTDETLETSDSEQEASQDNVNPGLVHRAWNALWGS
ncbi:hypothetical protein MVES_001686 [Malassezia vespertilionis]|uniref:DUF654-domain-containing protein n=1 Tax=Malassezia vespertilionis TaxID=2020962 RepID=A0A2N1JDG0_9BASI|nr:hypothetical protein MVES_001686 [Malassezia vespertilionis]